MQLFSTLEYGISTILLGRIGSLKKRPYLSNKIITILGTEYQRGEDAPDHCNSNATMEISNKRAAPWINLTLWEDAALAKQLGVRLIYRNSHYNQRYGVNCADDQAKRKF